ncbi:MAG: electron transfer flavoprotein subunit alpha/FixB family protein, partial [Moraxella osloensis]|nr:electron transfer flavoprotein subunit alpha/FixB family protein [Moraxella osloensis]
MAILVYAEHDNKELKKATLNTVTAASNIGGDIVVLVAGLGCEAVAEQAAKVAGVSKVLCASNAAFEHQLAENVAKLVVSLAGDYSHIVAPATTTGKNFLPRVAALLDVNMLTDVTAVIDAETFERPIYAGNAIATVKDTESKKVITVRTT